MTAGPAYWHTCNLFEHKILFFSFSSLNSYSYFLQINLNRFIFCLTKEGYFLLNIFINLLYIPPAHHKDNLQGFKAGGPDLGSAAVLVAAVTPSLDADNRLRSSIPPAL